ncbi:MAG TPA: hypothetical protein DEP66_03805 [Acidimicrobiaceae bacterium]|nr:hypothetical protein [Acidimicrobiaceae bacterium]HCB37333.1 hypothetical protein [Acidimicrobiaceae bacterium]
MTRPTGGLTGGDSGGDPAGGPNGGPAWTDSHCHLPDDDGTAAGVATGETAAALVAEANADGVGRLVDVGTSLATSTAACARAARFDSVSATVGLHPHDAAAAPAELAGIEALISGAPARPVAVGECGLDYFRDHSDASVQRDAFAAQIEMARRHDLALVVHSRDAWDDTFAVLDSVGVPERTVFHCFTGGVAEARKALDRGAWVSFSGIVSFANAEPVRAAAAFVPAGRYLVETDAPYLAPVPNRGKTNRPAWVRHVGAAVAAVRECPAAQVAAESTAAAVAVFGLR